MLHHVMNAESHLACSIASFESSTSFRHKSYAFSSDLRLSRYFARLAVAGLAAWPAQQMECNQKSEKQTFRKNAYRVLLTRARHDMIIFVPEGNPNDPTTRTEEFETTAPYLVRCGVVALNPQANSSAAAAAAADKTRDRHELLRANL
jgi:hypothetical protein